MNLKIYIFILLRKEKPNVLPAIKLTSRQEKFIRQGSSASESYAFDCVLSQNVLLVSFDQPFSCAHVCFNSSDCNLVWSTNATCIHKLGEKSVSYSEVFIRGSVCEYAWSSKYNY